MGKRIYRVAVALGLGLAGCGHEAVRVSTTDNGGIPFFRFEAVNVATELFEQKWFEVTVAADVVTSETKVEDYAKSKFTQSLTMFTTSEARGSELLRKVGTATETLGAWTAASEFMTKPNGFTLAQPDPVSVLTIDTDHKAKLASIVRTRIQVPGARIYYVNSDIPFGGTGSNSFQLGPNGTLSQAAASVTDALPGNLLTAASGLGSAAITGFTGLAGAKAAAAAAAAQPATAQSFIRLPDRNNNEPGQLRYLAVHATIVPVKRTYKLVLEWSVGLTAKQCDLAIGTRFAPNAATEVGEDHLVCRGSYTVDITRGAAGGTAGGGGSDADNSAIQIKGTVSLPGSGGKP